MIVIFRTTKMATTMMIVVRGLLEPDEYSSSFPYCRGWSDVAMG